MAYAQIRTTAANFVHANTPITNGETSGPEPDVGKLSSLVSSSFAISFGHSYFTSTRPALQSTLDFPGFIAHQKKMMPLLASVKAEVKDVFVDVERRTAIVTSGFHMTPKSKGEGETVVNEIVWFLEVDGEGRVCKAVEWVDAAAAGRLGELFRMNAAE